MEGDSAGKGERKEELHSRPWRNSGSLNKVT